jgi:hypothetical protein
MEGAITGAMEPELGVLLALLLKGSDTYKDSYNALIQDILAGKNTPKRISWEGDEELLEDYELVICMLLFSPDIGILMIKI